MKSYVSVIFLAFCLMMAFTPHQVSAVSIKEESAVIGKNCIASGDHSTAMGLSTEASGYSSTAMGSLTEASGDSSTAMGLSTEASGDYSTAMGYSTEASGDHSTAMGFITTASGDGSTAMGRNITASGQYSTVIGKGWGSHKLINDIEASFMVGYMSNENDTIPEFFVKDGGVGIGTKTPYHLLDLGNTIGKKLAVYQKVTGDNFYGFGISPGTFEFYAGGDSEAVPKMVMKSDTGRVGIGIADPGYRLHVNGIVAGTSWTNLSSRTFKEDIQKIDDATHPMMLAKLMDLDLTTYKYKKEYGGDGVTKLGFIAEDMPKEVLSKDGKGVDLYELLTLTIGAMKAQQKEIEEQRMENKTMKEKVLELISRIDALEK